MAPTALAAAPAENLTDADFDLDLRVFEKTTPTLRPDCDTSDGCGNTCDTSACNTSSYDPA
jgi:FxLD family lantipeptide